MAGDTIIIGNWNDTTPAAPAGADNVKFQKDASSPPNISAYVPRADTAGTKYGTIIYDGSGNANRYLGADGAWHYMPAGSLPNGGATGQVLAKASNDDGDVGWVDSSSGGGGWVDRGDPATDDITLASLLADNSWHDLDLSAIVPVGAKIIRLRLRTNPGTSSARLIYFRKNGNSNTYSITGVEHETEWHYKMTVVDVFCDSDRKIEYLVSGSMYLLSIVVVGWYL